MAKILDKASKGGVQKFISLTEIRDLEIPFPTYESQIEIVKELDNEMSIIEGVKQLEIDAENRVDQVINAVWES